MKFELPTQDQWPQEGFYHHYKHDPTGPVHNYAYYIYGVGHATEDCPPEWKYTQVYRPLYEAYVFKNGKMFDIRPLYMFFEPAQVNGVPVPRFVRITDPVVIDQLRVIKAQMYPES